MKSLRTSVVVLAVAAAGIAGSVLVGRLVGMEAHDLAQLGLVTLPTLAGTILAAVLAQPLLARASIAWRMVSIATVAAGVSLANLVVASRMMFLSGHEATALAVL